MSNDNTPNTAPVIYFDLDGVLADFDRHATEQGKRHPDGRINYDLLDEQSWWSGMPECEGAKAFYDEVSAKHDTMFLTAPVLSPECHTGKVKWVMNFTQKGKWVINNIIVCPKAHKKAHAEPNHILIDDNAGNIAEWEAAGGIGILHQGDWKATRAALDEAVAKIEGQQQGFASRVESERHAGPRQATR